jgi:hypothetical protein
VSSPLAWFSRSAFRFSKHRGRAFSGRIAVIERIEAARRNRKQTFKSLSALSAECQCSWHRQLKITVDPSPPAKDAFFCEQTAAP